MSRVSISQQISSLATAKGWLQQAGVAYLQRTAGVRANELQYVLSHLEAVNSTLEWCANNRPAIEAWIASKRDSDKTGGKS